MIIFRCRVNLRRLLVVVLYLSFEFQKTSSAGLLRDITGVIL